MATEPTCIGALDTLGFKLSWDTESPASTSKAADATRGTLQAFVGGRLVWGCIRGEHTEGFSWTWIELLEHLAENWPSLRWHELGPFGTVSPPSKWRAEASERWANLPQDIQTVEEDILWDYEDAHNLAAALQGAWPEALWVLRRGEQYCVESKGVSVLLDRGTLMDSLTTLGDLISSRLAGLTDERATLAVSAWAARDSVQRPERAASIITGIPEAGLRRLTSEPDAFADEWELGPELEPTELMAVARSTQGLLDMDDMRGLLCAIRAVHARSTPELDTVSGRAEQLLRENGADRPFEAGYRLAMWFRKQVSCPEDVAVDVEQMLRDFAVYVGEVTLESVVLDAVCCWGPRHGPAVLINTKGAHASSEPGRRATLAHELGHLLVDRHSALPLAEVYGGHTYKDVEARANAFAAEFLLPRAAARTVCAAAEDGEDYLRSSCGVYDVSREMAAWQLRNSGHMPEHFSLFLSTQVSAPDQFLRGIPRP